MKKISIVVPCYNEEKCLLLLYKRLNEVFSSSLKNYDYEIIISDNYSSDSTRQIIMELCNKDSRVKAIFNAANFGFSRNVFSALTQAQGDAALLLYCDMQDPPEIIPQFVEKWERGSLIVIGKKTVSKENNLIKTARKAYYSLVDFLSDTPQIRDFNGFGLYDRLFLDILREFDFVEPHFRSIVSEYAANYATVEYTHEESVRERSHSNFYKNYDYAMQGITAQTKKLMRIAMLFSVIIGLIGVGIAVYVTIQKILNWESYELGQAAILVGLFIIGATILFFISILGEYILNINNREVKKPKVLIERKINF